MSNSSLAVAKRYGQALYELAAEKEILDQLEQEMRSVIQTILENESLKRVIEHQLMRPELKQKIVKAIFSQSLSSTGLHFLLLVLQKRREASLVQMVERFIELADEARGIVKANVKSAQTLSPEMLEKLQASLVQMAGKKVEIVTEIDGSILGGVVVSMGDKIIDGSVATKLKRLENHLKNANFEDTFEDTMDTIEEE